jgi:hypothetical protein
MKERTGRVIPYYFVICMAYWDAAIRFAVSDSGVLKFYSVSEQYSVVNYLFATSYSIYSPPNTRKNAQVVTNLQQTCSNAVPTTCQQDVFALLVPSLLTSCQRLVNNLLQGCWAQQTCYKLFQQFVIVLQLNNLSTSCEWQPCSNLIK